MKREMPTELVRILEGQEMRGERLVNTIRLAFVAISAVMLAGSWPINTTAANTIFTIQLALWGAYAVGLFLWFRKRPATYVRRLKYLSITVDLGLLALAAPAMARNHSGIIEYLTGFVPTVFLMWNLMSGFRYNVRACWYSAGLTFALGLLVLGFTLATNAVPVSDVSVYGKNAINVSDQLTQIVFLALPGVVAGIIAKISRNLVIRAEEESLNRARLEREKEQLGKYLSKELVDFVLADPSRLQLGGTRRVVTVMFTDIRNFTPLTERIEPEQLVNFLNEYFTEMVEIVFRYRGTLDKYIGDGLMAVFGAPFAVEDSALRAVLAAMEMAHALDKMNERIVARGLGAIDFGVGICTGTVVSGNIGSLQRMEYTCIGDTVNTAARLEQLNKDMGSRIMISEATHEELRGRLPARQLGSPVRVRGKQREMTPYVIETDKITPALLAQVKKDNIDTADTPASRRSSTSSAPRPPAAVT